MHHSRLAGADALSALAYEEAAGHFRHALDVQRRAAQATPASRAGLLLSLAEALTKTGTDPAAARVIDEAVRLARDADEPRLLAAAALLNAQHLDFNAPADTATALLREAAAALDPADHALRARVLARLAITLAAAPAEARDAAERAVQDAREAVSRDPDEDAAAAALATALAARHYVLWGTQDPADALAAADEIVTAAQRAREPETELDGRVLRLTHLLELGDGPAAQRVLPELDRMAEWLRQPAVRLAALSRRSTLAALTGDFGPAAEIARQAFQTGQAAGLPDAGAVYWGQLFAIWLHAGLPAADEQWMERELRDLVARSNLSVAHAAALVQIEAAHGAVEQARGRLDELVGTGLGTMRPDMLYLWALTLLARDCVVLRAAGHAPRVYQALAPYAGRAAVAAGAVMCAGSADFYLAGLAALSGDTAAADRHYRAAASMPPAARRPAHARAHPARARAAAGSDPFRRVGGARRGAGHRRRLRHDQAARRPRPGRTAHANPAHLTLRHEDDFWLVGFADAVTRVPDSLGLRYLDLLIRQPGRDLAALELVQLAAATGPAAPRQQKTACTTRPEPGPTRSSTSRPGPPTGSASPPSTRNSPKPRRGTTPSGPAACAPRRTSWSVSSPPRPGSAAGPAPRCGIRTCPAQRHPRHQVRDRQASATAPRPPPPTSTGPSGPAPAARTPRRTTRAEHDMRQNTLRVRLLGPVDLQLDNQPLPPLDSARAESLLAYLLLHRDAPQPRQRLAFLLWPGSSEGQAQTNLRKVLHTLRRALPDADRLIEIGPRTLRWRPDAPLWLDVERFERAVADGRSAEAVGLYAGDLLEGRYDDWLTAERERLAGLHADALQRLARQHEQDHRWPEAIRCAERLIARDPLREDYHRLLIGLCRASGDRARAVRAYHVCATTLEDELGIEPAPETRVLYESLVAGGQGDGPAPTEPARSPAPRRWSGATTSGPGWPRPGRRRHPGIRGSCSSPARRASARPGWSRSCARTRAR